MSLPIRPVMRKIRSRHIRAPGTLPPCVEKCTRSISCACFRAKDSAQLPNVKHPPRNTDLCSAYVRIDKYAGELKPPHQASTPRDDHESAPPPNLFGTRLFGGKAKR